MTDKCEHMNQAHVAKPNTQGCEECLKTGEGWVALRMCMVCGRVGCCDSSPGRHATQHFHDSGHPVMKSIEPGQDWSWCYIHEAYQ